MSSETVSADPGDWTAEQARSAQDYGTCRACGAPRTTVTEERDGGWRAGMACLNGHRESDV